MLSFLPREFHSQHTLQGGAQFQQRRRVRSFQGNLGIPSIGSQKPGQVARLIEGRLKQQKA